MKLLPFEIWKDIPGYEGLYQASSMGNIRSLGMWTNSKNGSIQYRKGRVLKQGITHQGYHNVVLCKDGGKKTFQVQTLVLLTFKEKPTGLVEVNHIDENKSNNQISNLEWCSHSYNINYGKRNAITRTKLSKPIVQCLKDGRPFIIWPNITMIQNTSFSNSRGNICSCLKGRRAFANGYKWRYATEEETLQLQQHYVYFQKQGLLQKPTE